MSAPLPEGTAAIEAALGAARAARRPALVAYLTAGFPDTERFARALAEVARVADVVEIGVPFSDPMADGVTIQRASRRALEQGVTLRAILDGLGAWTERPATPLVLMSYLNPLLQFGLERLAREMVEARVAGAIVPDLPLEESAPLDAALAAEGLALIQLVSPVTDDRRLAALCRASRGFVYAVTVTGTTGGKTSGAPEFARYLARVRAASSLPVLAGFGIRDAAQVRALSGAVDGIIVGSALVECLERGEDPAAFLLGLMAKRDES